MSIQRGTLLRPMLLFQKRFHEGLTAGSITLTFRRWKKPLVKPGGRYRCHPIGVLEVSELRVSRAEDITEDDAKRSGFGDLAELTAYLASANDAAFGPTSEVFRVELHHAGDGDRVSLAMEADLSEEDVANITGALAKLDAPSRWTLRTLELIRDSPRIAASKLAPTFKLETAPFKARVLKLKKLGLTQSFEVGYEVSPRGVEWMTRRAAANVAKTKVRRPSPR